MCFNENLYHEVSFTFKYYIKKKQQVVQANCSEDQWQCQNKQCIPKEYVCNDNYDCLDHSDEEIGCTQILPCDTFRCKNGHCIPNEWKCDGSNDCHDNSDEIGCGKKAR